MDTTRTIYKPPIHEHTLFPSALFRDVTCGGCNVKGTIYVGYFCNECRAWFHKDCAEAPLEINHPSHPEHPLLLTTTNSIVSFYTRLLGKLVSPYYACPTCDDFKVDFICGIKQHPHAIEHPMCHDHPLVFLKKGKEKLVPCEVCKESTEGSSYSCLECRVYFHVDCVHLSKEVNHPCHSSHPLIKVIANDIDDHDIEKRCHFCSIKPKKVFYHCHLCNFTMCLPCTKNPPPLVIEKTKTHLHPLRLLTSKIKFTCKVCGIEDYDTKSYICIECGDFVVNGCCIDLPRVININRHDHRISLRHRLDYGHTKCGVCRKTVSQYYEAYSCSVCPNFALHTQCARNYNVWDGKELEGIPEIKEDIAPFKVVGDNLISHFSHKKHTLRLHKDITNMFCDDKCKACMCSVGFDPIYSCEECRFILHEKCANIPKKKNLVFDVKPYTLKGVNTVVRCDLCGILSGGFKYKSDGDSRSYGYIDVHCGSISEPFIHDGHLHPLYFYINSCNHRCDACKSRAYNRYLLHCDYCGFNMCFYCATLPKKIWHRSDDDEHPLSLCCGGKLSDAKYFCDVCEMELDTILWFFKCSTCGVNVHIQCVLGDFSRLEPGTFLKTRKKSYQFGQMVLNVGDKSYKVVLNNRNTRPSCSWCHSRCNVSLILKDNNENNRYICSDSCLSRTI